jgi:DNA topoisomerase-1
LGLHPTDNQPVIATQGRFGPFLKHGSDSRSIPAEYSLLEITLEQALEVLAQPKAMPGRGRGVAAPPLKTLEASPVTGKPIELRDGRYGLYVTDGQTNASLPKNTSGEELSFEQAVLLLEARAAQGPSKKKAKAKRATTAPAQKKAAQKKVTDKPAKKAAKKAAKKTAKKAVKKKTTKDKIE